MVITPLPVVLEDDDVLEMVNAGLVPITITDDYLAQFWKKVFTNLTVHADVAVRSGGELAIAVRKENPRLLRARQHVDSEARQGRRVPKHDRASLSRRREVREERRVRGRAQEVPGGRRPLQEVRRASTTSITC